MKKLIGSFVFYLTLSSLLDLHAQETKDTLVFRVMSYNVENLFDTHHDSLKNDYEYLPGSVRHWDFRKYQHKLNQIARAIISTGNWTPPALVGLCEVENDSVLRDLNRYSLLATANYRYIVTNSKDERGIDVALLYQREIFKPISIETLSVKRPSEKNRFTRDILHVTGRLINRDSLDVFVAHFPSRSGGAKASEPYRLNAAHRIRQAVDSLFQVRTHPQIIIMGDFNDYPKNKSVRDVLQARSPQADEVIDSYQLYHLLAGQKKGSYKYRGIWGLLDHLIVSGTLLNPEAPLSTRIEQAGINHSDFLLTEDSKYGGKQPYRSYYGMKYIGGFSDHLPVWAEFRLIY